MNGTVLGIDLGTYNIKICEKNSKLLVCEKNVIAIENGSKLYAFGDDAYDMYEKAPDNIAVTFPIQGGVIADYNNMQTILNSFFQKHFKNKVKGATVIIAVPTDITEVEKRAYFDLVDSSQNKFQNIYVCEKPIAAAVGLGLPINSANGMLIVDMGADTTEISVLSLGGIVISSLLKVGGNDMAQSIISSIKKEHNLVIGSKTANNLLNELGYAYKPEECTTKVVGRNMITGFPTTVEISSQLVYESIKNHFAQMVESIKFILERTPPELTSDIIDNGIYLSGGVSKVKNADLLFSTETELKVNVCDDPIERVAVGLNQIASERELTPLASCKKGKGKK